MVEQLHSDDGTITVEYQLAPRMVVFSHDFASLRDDRGLLSDIAANLPPGYGYMLFDYYDTNTNGKYIQVKSFAEQLRRLATVLDWVRTQPGVEQVSLIAHALGCTTVAALNPSVVESVILLAPPMTLGDDWEQYSQLVGGKKVNGIWNIQRADGTVVNVPDSFLHELKSIDGEANLTRMAAQRSYLIILPSHDEVLDDVDYTGLIVLPTVHAESIDNTNHYFDGDGRQQLIEVIKDRLLHPEHSGAV